MTAYCRLGTTMSKSRSRAKPQPWIHLLKPIRFIHQLCLKVGCTRPIKRRKQLQDQQDRSRDRWRRFEARPFVDRTWEHLRLGIVIRDTQRRIKRSRPVHHTSASESAYLNALTCSVCRPCPRPVHQLGAGLACHILQRTSQLVQQKSTYSYPLANSSVH